jgi:excisionase family DNA binding protein
MRLEISITDDDIERIATRTAELLADTMATGIERWLDVPGAADHVALTPDAIRALVKRGQIPFHRTENGRLRFSVTELDHWVRTRSCAVTNEDLP